jgi:hypothetical protein
MQGKNGKEWRGKGRGRGKGSEERENERGKEEVARRD